MTKDGINYLHASISTVDRAAGYRTPPTVVAPPGTIGKTIVSVLRAPHVLCCRALEVQKDVCAPDALHLRHPVNAYNEVA